MGFDHMPRPLIAGLMLLALAACGQQEPQAPDGEAEDRPRIASLEDYALPVDTSDQITAIDAATGDASGMPRDGGAVVKIPKPEERSIGQKSATATAAVPAAPPVVVPPPPPQAAPALTIPLGN